MKSQPGKVVLMFNPAYPPRNRMASELPILRIELEHAGGIEVFDPNSLVMALVTSPGRIAALNPLEHRVSDISQQPAILYRAGNLEVALTPAEMLRFAGHDLQPSEYFALRSRYGDVLEWHDDFYDEETGEAIQPLSSR